MDMDEFITIYFSEIGKALQDLLEPDKLISYVWEGTKAMISNKGNKSNKQIFMETFGQLIVGDLAVYQQRFDEFYDVGFLSIREYVEPNPEVKEFIAALKEKGYSLAIATNPLFPKKAILHRIEWADLNPEDFDYISCYEENSYCKPHIEFYQEVIDKLSKTPDRCMMVGNDVQEDLIASELGIQTYLITDHLLNRQNVPAISNYQGSYKDFAKFVEELPDRR
jgi:FMN phosphatase YigB (HAD superfamily)